MKLIFHAVILSFLGLSCVIHAQEAGLQPGGCYDEDTKHFWPVGESYNPVGHCISMNCVSHDGVFDALPCAPYVSPEGDCEVIEEDLTKPYPECCSTMKCKESAEKIETVMEGARTATGET